MREVNFSIPNINKACVYVTPTLYDRRALDCTSTLPLINSLNHLTYLTTSSARIRDILTVDGGVERLICILKEGRSGDEVNMWKWNLAFQCVVNIGVRGTELVRTRVVEADMVPVIATILHDFMVMTDRDMKKSEKFLERPRTASMVKVAPRNARLSRDREPAQRVSFLNQVEASEIRRTAPPSLDLSQPFTDTLPAESSHPVASPPAPVVFTSPPERTVFARPPIRHHRSHDSRNSIRRGLRPTSITTLPSMEDVFTFRPVQEGDRLPSMLPTPHSAVTSNPDTPTTPSVPGAFPPPDGHERRRPSIREQLSTEDVTMQGVETLSAGDIVEQEVTIDPHSGQDTGETTPRAMPDASDLAQPITLNIPTAFGPDEDHIDIQRTPTTATALEALLPREETNSPGPNAAPIPSPALPMNPFSHMMGRTSSMHAAAALVLPREDDVILSLQLLAYISKYCDLRHYFQETHLVPRLRVEREIEKVYGVDPVTGPVPAPSEDELEEYLQRDDINIFPLVEKFAQPHYTKDMRNWACIVMRNSCRKDDTRGTRQCANYRCGKWEEYPRQFAKCRRCKRTKYCSKVGGQT